MFLYLTVQRLLSQGFNFMDPSSFGKKGVSFTCFPGPVRFSSWPFLNCFEFLSSAIFLFALDTSENRVYSISRGSKDLLKKLEDTVFGKNHFLFPIPPHIVERTIFIGSVGGIQTRFSMEKFRIEYLDPGTPKNSQARPWIAVLYRLNWMCESETAEK